MFHVGHSIGPFSHPSPSCLDKPHCFYDFLSCDCMELSSKASVDGLPTTASTPDRRASSTGAAGGMHDTAADRTQNADQLGPALRVHTANGTASSTSAAITTEATSAAAGEPVRHAKRLLVGCRIGSHTIEKCASPKKKALDPMRYMPDRAAFYALFTVHVQFEGASDDHQVYRTYKQLGALHSRVSLALLSALWMLSLG